jgi:hypothetical protein
MALSLGTLHANKLYSLSRGTREQSKCHPLGHLATQARPGIVYFFECVIADGAKKYHTLYCTISVRGDIDVVFVVHLNWAVLVLVFGFPRYLRLEFLVLLLHDTLLVELVE